MSETVKVDLTVVSPPDIYLPISGPRIYLCGPGDEWKDFAVEYIEENWSNWSECDSITVFRDHALTKEIDWTITSTKTCSNKICYIGNTDNYSAYMSFLLGVLSDDENTIYVISDDAPDWILKILNSYDRGILVGSIDDALDLVCTQWNAQY